MKLINLSQFDIEALKEQGAEIQVIFIENKGLPLDFQRGYDGYDYYKVIIDSKYHAVYQRRYKVNLNYRYYLDKIQF